MNELRPLPIGVQNFENLRKSGFLYVDKTALLYRLVTTGHYYFLSRPRRFGKSLLVSTLEAYFQGRKELFKGLAIEGLEKEWAVHPVFHLDLNTQKYDALEKLDQVLNRALTRWEELYGASEAEATLSLRFEGVIRRACEQTGQGVVILVDEYDKPMLQAIGNEKLQEDYRSTLKAFYGALKSMDRYIRLGLLTGVTKFSKVSVFSDLNNLEDISMSRDYYALCGITEEELHADFGEYARVLSAEQGIGEDKAYALLKEYYDGYHFAANVPGVYNPFSLLNAFKSREFGNY